MLTEAPPPSATLPPAPLTGRVALTAAALAENLAGRDDATRETLEWFRHHCLTRTLSWDEAGKRLHKPNGAPYSRDSVYQALSGARGLEVSLEPLCKAIEAYRRNVEAPVPVDGFLETRMAREIRIYTERAQAQWKIGFIVGHNAVGKTTAIEHLARRDPRVTAVRMREGGHLSAFLRALALRRGFGGRQTVANYSDALAEEFGAGDVLAIDEADEAFNARSSVLGSKTLTYIRRIFDERRCAVVMVMDPAGYKKLQSVQADNPLRRLYSRRLAPLFLPKFYREDLDLFAAQQGLEPAPNLELTVKFTPEGGREISHKDNPQTVQDAICSSHRDGLFVWLGLLKEAAEMARAAGKPHPTWHWVLKAHALFAAMESEGLQ